ncbi:MAG TPA: alpha/beta hydrolase [Spirochaetales bacterium]|nr:alpha/beta hydrolase [Spirochaetales bacterium]
MNRREVSAFFWLLMFIPRLCFGAGLSVTSVALENTVMAGTATLKPVRSTSGSGAIDTSALNLSLRLRLVGQGKALIDIPEQSLFGYPLAKIEWTDKVLSFELDAWGPGQEMRFRGVLSALSGQSGAYAATGMISSKDWQGSFSVVSQARLKSPGVFGLAIQVQGGELPGTLVLPKTSIKSNGTEEAQEAQELGEFSSALDFFPVPLVVLLSGAGPTDRDGNNFSVPGQTNTLAQLSQKLAEKGVATYRFDKRGSGEAYWLEKPDQVTSIAIHAQDAAEVIRYFCSSGRFSRVLVAGMNEGAWVGAMALNRLQAAGVLADGLIVLDASGEDPEDQLASSLRTLSPEVQAEAERIRAAIEKGEPYAQPSAQLAAFFAPTRSEWVAAWLACHPAQEIASVSAPVFFVRGDADLQVSRGSFEKLLAARPDAAAFSIPSMNYVLKLVKSSEENYDAFVNPSYEIPQVLVDLVEALAKVKSLPETVSPYQRLNDESPVP